MGSRAEMVHEMEDEVAVEVVETQMKETRGSSGRQLV